MTFRVRRSDRVDGLGSSARPFTECWSPLLHEVRAYPLVSGTYCVPFVLFCDAQSEKPPCALEAPCSAGCWVDAIPLWGPLVAPLFEVLLPELYVHLSVTTQRLNLTLSSLSPLAKCKAPTCCHRGFYDSTAHGHSMYAGVPELEFTPGGPWVSERGEGTAGSSSKPCESVARGLHLR